MVYSRTDPESYITKYTLVYEDETNTEVDRSPRALHPTQLVTMFSLVDHKHELYVSKPQDALFARWPSRVSLPRNFKRYVTTFPPNKALK